MRELDSVPFTVTADVQAPHTYRYSAGWKWLITLGSAALLPLFVWVSLLPVLEPGGPAKWFLPLIGLPMVALFVLGTVEAWRSRLVLRGDGIELIQLGAPRRLLLEEIAGVRIQRMQNGSVLHVIPKQTGVKPLKLNSYFRFDAAFMLWLDALPDLDAEDTQREFAALAAAPELGRSEEERLARLQRARRFAGFLSFAAFAVAAWIFFYPRPYTEAILVTAAVPLLALLVLMTGRGVWRVNENKNDPHPSVFTPLFIPGLGLALRALLDFQLVEARPALEQAGAGAVLLVALLFLLDRTLRVRLANVLLLLPFAAAYTWGLVVTVNGVLDRSGPQVFSVKVLDKHVSSGKQTTYNLQLEPWGPVAEPEQVSVPRRLYEHTTPGDEVQVQLRPGRLGMPWYTVAGDE